MNSTVMGCEFEHEPSHATNVRTVCPSHTVIDLSCLLFT